VAADESWLVLEATGRSPGPVGEQAEHLRDRAEAVGGQLRVADLGTEVRVAVELPADSASDLLPGAQQQAGVKG